MSRAAKRRRSTTCTISRNPTAGLTGVTNVVTGLPCTPPYPANPQTWQLATGFNGWEIITNTSDLILDEDVLTMASGEVFIVKRQKPWPSHNGKTGFIHMLLMERGA